MKWYGMSGILYPNGCLSIERKYTKSKEVQLWQPHIGIRERLIDRTFWNKDNEKELLKIGYVKFKEKYKISKSSAYMKYMRLNGRYQHIMEIKNV